MQVETPAKLRNVALAGHNDTGKTTLASALLFAAERHEPHGADR